MNNEREEPTIFEQVRFLVEQNGVESVEYDIIFNRPAARRCYLGADYMVLLGRMTGEPLRALFPANYHRPVTPEFTAPDDKQYYADHEGIYGMIVGKFQQAMDDQPGEWLTVPVNRTEIAALGEALKTHCGLYHQGLSLFLPDQRVRIDENLKLLRSLLDNQVAAGGADIAWLREETEKVLQINGILQGQMVEDDQY